MNCKDKSEKPAELIGGLRRAARPKAVEVTHLEGSNQVILALLAIVTSVVALFGWLLKHVMTENAAREKGYRDTIEKNQLVIAENQRVIADQQGVIARLADRYEDLKEAITDLAQKFGGAA